MEVSNTINYSNTQIIGGYYKFNNVNSQTSTQTVSGTDTLFYIELPATSQAFNPSKCRLEFSAKVLATAANTDFNTLLANVSPVTRCEIKTWSGQTILNYSRCQAYARTLPDRVKISDNSLSSLVNGRFICNPDNSTIANITKTDVYDFYNGKVLSVKPDNIDNAVISTNNDGTFTYSILLSDVIGGFFWLNKDVMLNEWLYINLYLNNTCVGVFTNATPPRNSWRCI